MAIPVNMRRLSIRSYSLLRPVSDDLTSREKSQVQLHRVLSLIGAVLIPCFGLLYHGYNRAVVDPIGVRLALSGLLVTLVIASYGVSHLRRYYVLYFRTLLYLVLGWSIVVTMLNHFSGDYVTGLLLVYAVGIAVVGLGSNSMQAVVWFSAVGLILTAEAIHLTLAPYTTPPILLASMVTVAFLEGGAIRAYMNSKETTGDEMQQLRSVARCASEGVYRAEVGSGIVWANPALAEDLRYDDVEELLGSDPADLFADDATVQTIHKQLRSNGGVANCTIALRRKDGSTVPGRFSAKAVPGVSDDGLQYDAVVSDPVEAPEDL